MSEIKLRKSVLQTVRFADGFVLDEIDVSGFSEARVKRYMAEWEENSSGNFFLRVVDNKTEWNGL